jgi:predicted TIM-barrel fold metal-dependent hydrolase
MAKNGFRVMDSDIHVREPGNLWLDYIEPAFRDQAPRVVPDPTLPHGGRWQSLGKAIPAFSDREDRQRTLRIRASLAEDRNIEAGHVPIGQVQEGAREGADPREMLAAMKVEGIDVAICFRTEAAHVIGIDDMDPELAAAMCRAFNNWLRDFCAAEPARLKIGALMPMHDVSLAVAEARRAVEELGAITLVLPNNQVRSRPWYDEYYEPFWAEAERLDTAVSFHGIQMAYQDHLARRFMDNHALGHSVAHPLEMMCALGAMLTGGIFERHPGLRAAFLEAHSSWVPWWLYCLDEHEIKMGDKERFGLKLPPSEYFRRQCYVSVDPDEHLVKYTVQEIGDDNLVISTDWPHDDSAYPHATDQFLALEGLSDDNKRKILWDNCARLYHLD